MSQEKRRTLELLGVKEVHHQEQEESVGGEEKEVEEGDLLQDLRHIEDQMKLLLQEKDQAEAK